MGPVACLIAGTWIDDRAVHALAIIGLPVGVAVLRAMSPPAPEAAR